jgi:hypothetical protein
MTAAKETAKTYIKIKLHDGGSYLVPESKVGEAIKGELEALQMGDMLTFDFEMVELTEDEYENLAEFDGH